MRRFYLWIMGLGALLAGGHCAPPGSTADLGQCTAAHRPPRLDPDYTGVTMPPNIAPLNFTLREPGTAYRVEIYSSWGDTIEISSKTAQIAIPLGPWKELLRANRGQEIYFEVCAEEAEGRWLRFDPAVNQVAPDEIDNYLVYRLIRPLYNKFVDMGIYQRNLQNYEESAVLRNTSVDRACINCHTFLNNRPSPMLLHTRGQYGQGMLVIRQGDISTVDTETEATPAPASFASWHPSGRAVVFATPVASLFFHTTGETRDVFYAASDLALYLVDANQVTTVPQISRPDSLETFSTWSPDGRYLYFCRAPQLPIERFAEVRCDLMRISYDVESGSWGELEMVLSARDTGLSITEPRISPDGRFLVFCMSEYGNFPVYQTSSDLYAMDLHTGRYWRLEINSPQSESWHSWSSNSRWLVFSSKRRDGLFARPYFTYVDAEGGFHKPVVLPQEDPAFYESFARTYNLPELIQGPVQVEKRDLARAIYAPASPLRAVLDPQVQVQKRPEAGLPDEPYAPGVPQ